MAEKIFLRTQNIDEIVELKKEYGQKARVIAGGTDVMVNVNTLAESPECFLYIGEAGLSYIKEEGEKIIIGAATTLQEIIRSPLIQKELPILSEVAAKLGSVAIRNMATIGGNICNASPAADMAVPLLALGAQAVLISKGSQRTVAIKEFFTGPGETVLNPDEILKEFIIPKQGTQKCAYKKIGRRKTETLSIISVMVAAKLENGYWKDVKIALGAVAPTPILAEKAAALLKNNRVEGELIEKVAAEAEKETAPIDDQRSSAWYRKRMARVLVKNLLQQIVNEGR